MEKFSRVAILGSGAWGTTLATKVAKVVPDTIIYSRSQFIINCINNFHHNHKYLPDIRLSPNLVATGDLNLLQDRELIILAIPAQAIRTYITQIHRYISKDAIILISTKGIENNTLKLISEILSEIISNHVAIISGPNFAYEVASGQPSAAVIACIDANLANKIINTLYSQNLQLVYCADIIGVQLAGAAKNVIAIACGILSELDLGENAKATLITLGLMQMAELIKAVGGNLETALGLAGVGDLTLTCSSRNSRNMNLGYLLAKAEDINQLLANNTCEGYFTAHSIYYLAKNLNLNLSIFNAVYNILYQDASISSEINKLLTKTL